MKEPKKIQNFPKTFFLKFRKIPKKKKKLNIYKYIYKIKKI